MSTLQSLFRYLALQNNYAINPFFEAIEWSPDGDQSYLPNPNSNCYKYAPGWFPFGWSNGGTFSNNLLGIPANNAFEEGTGTPSRTGLEITQKPGFKFGVVQQLWRAAKPFSNRRVRVMGRYRVDANPDNLAGIFIALKSRYEFVEIGTSTVVTGTTTSYGGGSPGNQVGDSVGTPFAAVVTGDTIWVGNTARATAPGAGGDNSIYHVEGPDNNNLPVAGLDFTSGASSDPYEVVTGNNWIRDKAVRIDNIPLPLHIISFNHQPGTATDDLNDDSELLVRAWDYLRTPETGSPSNTPDPTPPYVILSLGREAEGDSDGGVPQKSAGTDVKYLSEDFLNDGVDDQTLVSETQTGTSTTEVEFDEIVDLGALLGGRSSASDQGLWMVVMPVAPSNVGSMTGNAKVTLLTVTISLVPEDDSVGQVLDAQAPMLRQSGGPLAFSGFPARFLQRYPIYQPCLLPLNVALDHGEDDDNSYTTNRIRPAWFMLESNPAVEKFSRVSFLGGAGPAATIQNKRYVARQDGLPPGACVLEAVFPMSGYAGVDGGLECQLVHTAAITITGTIDPVAHRHMVLASWSLPELDGAGNKYASVKGFVDRLRVGTFWSDGGSDFDTIQHQMSAGEVWFHVKFPGVVDETNLVAEFLPGWIYAVVDPRWGHAMWRRGT